MEPRAGFMQRLARAAIVLVVTGIAVLTMGYWLGPESFWLLALAQYVPYPAFLIPSLATVALSATLGWRFRVGALVGFILALTSLTGAEFHRSDSASGELRLMTYNIKDYGMHRSGREFADIAQEIDRHNPDIVVLQDARQVASENASEEALKILGNRERFAFGQYVVASRFPLRECGRHDIPIGLNTHTYVSCVIVANGVEFELVTAHLLTPRSALAALRANPFRAVGEWKENIADRMAQAEKIVTDLSSHQRPLVIAGDFNAPDTSLVVRALLRTGLRDAFSVAGMGYGHTWGHSLRLGFSFLRIDHILVSPEFGVARCFVGGMGGSEHRPVIADLYLTRG